MPIPVGCNFASFSSVLSLSLILRPNEVAYSICYGFRTFFLLLVGLWACFAAYRVFVPIARIEFGKLPNIESLFFTLYNFRIYNPQMLLCSVNIGALVFELLQLCSLGHDHLTPVDFFLRFSLYNSGLWILRPRILALVQNGVIMLLRRLYGRMRSVELGDRGG